MDNNNLQNKKDKLKISFSGHDKFDCKIDWIIKSIDIFIKDNSIFSDIDKSIEVLGLGKNKRISYFNN